MHRAQFPNFNASSRVKPLSLLSKFLWKAESLVLTVINSRSHMTVSTGVNAHFSTCTLQQLTVAE